ncbi:hypothetical protein L3C95_10775 [Chitinophaga filiformis]|uniref:hypothetical protein n=1 Tax=Chitinophaga filiformis TaxID=104663 RepID=UPI001F1DE7BC|nr:hypothetical protein [Chitinophaga filiformis]MCF6402721.1 hypothetical protein [Chitinophaga filiformis]MCF6403361.1 hypothetical protein [Chitinophaga filiformis]
MFKKYFFTGLAAGILSGLAAFFYYRIYVTALEVSYDSIVSSAAIFSASLFAGMLIALFAFGMDKLFKKEMETLTGILLAGGTLVSLIIPFMISLPLDVDRPELFPGLVVPMQLFPVLGWFAFKPFFGNLRS